jgi:hypothetical protein
MKSTVSSVGDIIDARCTKCRMVTNHVIVAMLGSKPADVQCNTCHGTHRYRKPVSILNAAKRASDSLFAMKEEWAMFRTAMEYENVKDYAMDKEYRVKAVIKHPIFGLGLVQRVVGDRKMEVLFEDGKKMMRCK